MAKQAGRQANLTVNAVAIEVDADSITLNVTQETPVVTSLGDTGPRRLAGNYDHNKSVSGSADFASGRSDATLFALIGSAGVATGFDPTGATAAANDPNYDTTDVLESYSITSAVGAAATYQASLQGTAALTRAVA